MDASVRVWYGVLGTRIVNWVTIAFDATVGELREAIYNKDIGSNGFAAHDLRLFIPDDPAKGDTRLVDGSDLRTFLAKGDVPVSGFKELEKMMASLKSHACFGPIFPSVLDQIHVLVKLHKEELPSAKRQRLDEAIRWDDEMEALLPSSVVTVTMQASSPVSHRPAQRLMPSGAVVSAVAVPLDGSKAWIKRFHDSSVPSDALPRRQALSELIQSPLPLKIPVEGSVYSDLVSNVDREVVDKMFVANDRAPCRMLWKKAFQHALHPLDGEGTENGYIGFWDSFIRRPIRTIFADRGSTNRNTSNSTSTGTQRPDMIFNLDQICVFRGEEKAADVALDIPRRELSDKIIWTYGDDAPYIFGYSASGSLFSLHVLYKASTAHTVETMQVGLYHTEKDTDRFECVLAVLHLCRLFDGVVRLCPDSSKREFDDIVRPNGVVVKLSTISVVKDFTNYHPREGHEKTPFQLSRQVERIYRELGLLRIPHMDALHLVSSCGLKLTFRPRGVDLAPSSLAELFAALECILTALESLHHSGWMHRDIRWSNVMKYRGSTPAWFLIDFVDAVQGTQTFPSGTHLTRHEHAPEIFVEGGQHTTAVDLWSVGCLIEEWDHQSVWATDVNRALFTRQLRNHEPTMRPTAAEALATLQELKRAASVDVQPLLG